MFYIYTLLYYLSVQRLLFITYNIVTRALPERVPGGTQSSSTYAHLHYRQLNARFTWELLVYFKFKNWRLL